MATASSFPWQPWLRPTAAAAAASPAAPSPRSCHHQRHRQPRSAPSTWNRRSSPPTKASAISKPSARSWSPSRPNSRTMNDEVESLKKQLSTQGEKLNDESRGTLVKQVEQKQKSLGARRPGCPRRRAEPAERNRAEDSAEDGSDAREVRRRQRLRRDHRHLESLAQGSSAVGRPIGRHHQACSGRLQRAVWGCCSNSVCSQAKHGEACRHDQAFCSLHCEAANAAQITRHLHSSESSQKAAINAAFFIFKIQLVFQFSGVC